MSQTVQKTFNTKRRKSTNSSPGIDSTAVGTKEFMNKNPLKQKHSHNCLEISSNLQHPLRIIK